MSTTTMSPKSRSYRLAGALLLASVLGVVAMPMASAKSRVTYKPGVALVPEVLQADGHQRTYNTPKGLSLWMDSLPIKMGDKIKLNVFAATGGSDLGRIIVRVDNARIAEIQKAPWNTVLDTSTMAPGYHMVEVFAETAGDRPQSTTKTQTFFITREIPGQYVVTQPNIQVAGSSQLLGGPEVNPANAIGNVPAFLRDQTPDPNAQVVVYARSGAGPTDAATTGGSLVGDMPVTINEPTLFIIQAAPGSTATNYAYALVRNGMVISAPAEKYELNFRAIRIQKRSATAAGLGSGPVTMYVWGVDGEGRPSSAATKVQMQIP